ncbi:hypothetical protein D554_2952 [Bordetella holmesii 30539]|uniref:N-acetyltransferase YedL n=1 Tax=Bordetella holmesii 1058 TaxID=1247648 RepID=A0ABN0RWM3_9BORD|nr:hypothetical protein D560_3034 [Bordetella holmesii ATCC 51541]AIT27658.1 hypothetical protein D558_3011 [Bordetella holmesii 44057]EWM40432.1 hypothetical protein D555_3070 [Bordetella holmesii 35009]EWM41494.1 hypothetical protein D556_3008 [Bordetella holmesii 41130]EXF87682.1 hypothetical protein D554_2952 [Bordetella holmesii 30539]EXX93682.1 hypothetical protein D559_1084 [Bordetella holmesii 1058]KAK81568.1 hypothetical protein L496_0814 [Bordetella holmesii CDC-H572-BH]KAK97335.1 
MIFQRGFAKIGIHGGRSEVINVVNETGYRCGPGPAKVLLSYSRPPG